MLYCAHKGTLCPKVAVHISEETAIEHVNDA